MVDLLYSTEPNTPSSTTVTTSVVTARFSLCLSGRHTPSTDRYCASLDCQQSTKVSHSEDTHHQEAGLFSYQFHAEMNRLNGRYTRDNAFKHCVPLLVDRGLKLVPKTHQQEYNSLVSMKCSNQCQTFNVIADSVSEYDWELNRLHG